jgi:Family of unknown function (DUF6545)
MCGDFKGSGYRELWRAGESLLRHLDLPQPFSADALAGMASRTRGRPLIILPLPLPASDKSPYGVWVEYSDADFILHEASTSPMHQDQIILHEIAHILLGHSPAAGSTDPAGLAGLRAAPALGAGHAVGAMGRHAYGGIREAEIIASLLMARTGESPPLPVPGDVLPRAGSGARHPAGGTSPPPAPAAARAVGDCHALHALRPLWSRLTAATPGIVLGPPPARPARLPAGAFARPRLVRRVVEIRDAGLLLRGHISDSAAACARDALAAAGLAGDSLDAAAEAAWLRAATAARLAGCPPADPPPTRPLRGGATLSAEAHWLSQVAAAWDHPATASAARAVTPGLPAPAR